MFGRTVLFAAVAAAAASTIQPQQTFRSGVDVVQVDVTVLDKDRRPVRGLTASDFTILEDGKPRPIVAFVPVDLAERAPVEGRAGWMRDVAPDVVTNDVRPEGRLVVIMFDWSIRFMDLQLARRIARAAVDQLGPDDLAAVVFTNATAAAGAPQNFTADRRRLLAAIERPFAVAPQNPPPPSPLHDPRNRNDVMLDDPEAYETGECLCRVCVAEAIMRIADTIRDVSGRRKTLLFIGTYFHLDEGLQGPADPRARPRDRTSPLIPMNPNIMTCAAPLRHAREAMLRATAAANLTINTIDPVGLETEWNSPVGGSQAGQMERRDQLTSLAELTGGRAILNTEAPEAKIPALFGESQSFYLLAFAPGDTKADGKFHGVTVKVDRRDVTVRTRSGYYAGGKRDAGVRASSAISPDTASAVAGVLPRNDLPLSVTAAPFAVSEGSESAVAVVLGVRQPRPAEGSAKSPVKVLAAAFDRNGKSVQSETKTLAVTWKADESGMMAYELLSRLTLKPGRYELRLALDAATNQRGSVYTYVDVPDFARQPLSLSGIVLNASPAPLAVPEDAFAGVLPVVPTSRRSFAASDRATAFARIYEAAKQPPRPVTVTARVVDANDAVASTETVTLAAERFAANRAADYRIDLPLVRLARGEYLLIVETTADEYSARRALRFSVR